MKSGPCRVPLLPLSSFVVPSSRIKKKKKKKKKRNRRKREKSKKGERTVVYGFPMVCRRKTISRQDNHCSHPPFFRWYASTLALALFSPIFLSFSLYYPFFLLSFFRSFFPSLAFFFFLHFIVLHAERSIRIYRLDIISPEFRIGGDKLPRQESDSFATNPNLRI